jgi:CTP synthase
VQVIPHITDKIKEVIQAETDPYDFVLVEIGGTVGDIESLPFLEAMRQLANELGPQRSLFMHLTLVPYIASAGELKTKPTQHSVKELLGLGIQPQILLCRSDRPIPENERRKIALFCNVRPESVIPALDAGTIYEVPLMYHREGLDQEVLRLFGMSAYGEPDMARWERIVQAVKQPEGEVTIAVVGKYTNLLDAYKSLSEALAHGGIAHNVKVNLDWVDSQIFENDSEAVARLEKVNGILVPGGFGERGSEGKIEAVRFARERRIPFFGICFGMQMAVIEAARNLLGIKGASSSEFGACAEPVVGLLTEWQRGNEVEKRDARGDLGGTMRLGAYPAALAEGSLVREVYDGAAVIQERHRHRYEVNVAYKDRLETAGLRFSGMSPDGVLPEIVEYPDHPWFIGVQYHPELKSKPFEPHPLFAGFVGAAVKQARLV